MDLNLKKSLSMSVLMTPSMANFSGNVHGGDILKLIDQVAYACATRYCCKSVVTLSVDNVLFKHPIPIGTLVTFLASVNYTGKSSMEIGIKVIAENIKEQTVTHTNSCFVTMVAVDENSRPVQIEPLVPKTDLEIRRFEDGARRKLARLKTVTARH